MYFKILSKATVLKKIRYLPVRIKKRRKKSFTEKITVFAMAK